MSQQNITQQLISAHLMEGEMQADEEIALKIDQTLTQDATGTLVMLELEAIGLKQVKTDVSVQYVDHNLIQEDNKNPEDHLFLRSACQRFGLWFSKPGNGISHPVHMQHFGVPGKTLLGSDSHTCAGGGLGMLAMGAGGMEVALAMAGHPLYIKMPQVFGIELTGKLPDWVSAKDVILEVLRRHGVKGGIDKVLEYFGEGVKHLSVMDRHIIANMGAELGATATVFPSDEFTKAYLKSYGREKDWIALDNSQANFDLHDHLDLSTLEPLIAKPSSPGNVVPVSEIAGEPIYQAYIGSGANPSFRDFATCARMVKGRQIPSDVSFDINPSSRGILEELIQSGDYGHLIHAGGRTHQAGCNGCIGMGQAPAVGRNSLRTTPRNFPGRSGTQEDSVFLCSPETATASAITGKITDPRSLGIPPIEISDPVKRVINHDMLTEPLPLDDALKIDLVKGDNIASLPEAETLSEHMQLPVVLKVGDDISTDGILPAGAKVLPYRSNIPKIAEFCFNFIDPNYPTRAKAVKKTGGHMIIAGENYGQGSSREHAALAPHFLGLRVVVCKSFARIHWQNLINFGVLPLTFLNPKDYDDIQQDDTLTLSDTLSGIDKNNLTLTNTRTNKQTALTHQYSERQIDILKAGGLINYVKARL